ncbi:pentatricopeptide repeat-containing protein At4g02750-like [Selaginella moellendorffii]|uniref:pentatricopeptide repeat-containing protein At4g02750-like n=1 Tax=Selaginella moellendorffii TaxID=88036 RepID=UPI000D1C5BC1|nr:pentatricopeptide repeat-containing protein At4g02750-like [Selaginella moellendorffii]|eukprot:XP_024520832.1 pentatricopeptide repeat-containing protein At4g02750-like [Selaginella moellendorffii]
MASAMMESVSFQGQLQRCVDLSTGREIHRKMVASGNPVDWNSLVRMYGRFGSLEEARRALESAVEPDVCAWTAMLRAYALSGHLGLAKSTFDRMPEPDLFAFNTMITAFARSEELAGAKALFDSMPERNVVSYTAMLQAYSLAGHLADAKAMFDKMPQRNVVGWTAMIQAYAHGGHPGDARRIFDRMPQRTTVSWNAMLEAYTMPGHMLEDASGIFDAMPEWSLVSWTGMLQMYATSGQLNRAARVFDSMPEHDIVCSTAMLQAYSQRGQMELAGGVLESMPEWNAATSTAMVIGFAHLGHLDLAKIAFHAMPEHAMAAWTVLLEALAVNGEIGDAGRVFDRMPERDLVSWTSMIAIQSRTRSAIHLFRMLCAEGLDPDDVCLTHVLAACNHVGMVGEGLRLGMGMLPDFGITAREEHLSSMIQALGRAGDLVRAQDLVGSGGIASANSVAWTALLAGCQIHRDVDRARRVWGELTNLLPSDAVPQILLGIDRTMGSARIGCLFSRMDRFFVVKLWRETNTVQVTPSFLPVPDQLSKEEDFMLMKLRWLDACEQGSVTLSDVLPAEPTAGFRSLVSYVEKIQRLFGLPPSIVRLVGSSP